MKEDINIDQEFQQMVLYMEVIDPFSFEFEKPALEQLKQQYPEALFLDMDNHSETMLVQYITKMMSQAQELIVHIEVSSENEPSQVLKVVNKLYPIQEKLKLTVGGKYYSKLSRYINPLLRE